MDKFIINGGKELEGTIKVSGAKNAVLPAMAAVILSDGVSVINNVPNLRDVRTMSNMLRILGAQVAYEDETLTIDTKQINFFEAPYDLVKTMRASVYVLGSLTARFGKAKVSLPGGCAWGPRPIDLHLFGLEKLGAEIKLEKGYIVAKAGRLKGAEIDLPKVSVGATGNILMAAVLAEGETVIRNAAMEPEITSLADNLNKMGAKIDGIGTPVLIVNGVSSLSPLNCTIIPDRIEAGTFIIGCGLAGGKIKLTNADPLQISSVIEKARTAGIDINIDENITVESDGVIHPVSVRTEVYPGFPTDMQAQWIALMSVAKGDSIVEDSIFYDRFTHVAELNRFGADITIEMNKAFVRGVAGLTGAPVMSTDLRASASLIIAGLRAKGQTVVERVYHIDRGYHAIEEKLNKLGADITRINE